MHPLKAMLGLLGMLAISVVMNYLIYSGDVVGTKEKVISEKKFVIEVGKRLPYDEYIPEETGEDFVKDYIYLGQEKQMDESGQQKQQIRIGKRTRPHAESDSNYEVQDMTITVEKGKEIPIIDTSDVRESAYIKLYFEGVNDNSLEIKAEKIKVEEIRENPGLLRKKINEKAEEDSKEQ
ncbi:hypothetical protein [Rossellomorea marisflavi]|uniref:hypothetical protein n=1 Tax=Rossellomorea marisflavi TaxID=189381 RepID=UPI003FA14F68